MDDTTQIKYEKVSAASEIISENKTKLQGILDDFAVEMNIATSEGVLQGTASDGLSDKFAELKKKFDSYISAVEEFEGMINMAKEETQNTEQNIQKAAEELAS